MRKRIFRYHIAAFAGILCLCIVVAIIIIPKVTAPTVMTIKAIDSANRIDDPAWYEQVYADGFRLYIMHSTDWGNTCTPWEHTQSQLKMALDAGLKIAVYTRNPLCWQGGIQATGPYQSQLQFFALDIEDDPGIPATRAMVNGIKAMGVRPVIYTSATMWPALQKNASFEYSDVPLWETNTTSFAYGQWKPNFLDPLPVAFGGWNQSTTMRIGVQQQFEYDLHDIKVDLNSFDASFMR